MKKLSYIMTTILVQMLSFKLMAAELDNEQLLGKTLFFDPILSGDNNISCASCHNPAKGWEDGLPLAVGHNGVELAFRTPTILDVATHTRFFWDGRETSLIRQALGPIQNPNEMNQDLEELVVELSQISGYRTLFAKAYPGRSISPQTIASAIAAFEGTVLADRWNSPMGRWYKGDRSALSASAERGKNIFFTFKGKCSDCHEWPTFTSSGVNNTGVKGNNDEMRFKTPGLWDVAKRGPYMHNGSEKTLEDVVDFYNEGGRVDLPSVPRHKIVKLGLDEQQKKDLVEFLKALSTPDTVVIRPQLPR